jgi:signal transduction histidine kinase/CheY-like chemotaxis protein
MSLSYKKRIINILNIAVILIAVLVMVGWITGNSYLKSVVPDFTAMNIFSALLFIFCGVAFLALRKEWKKTVLILSLLICALGMLRIIGFFADFDPVEQMAPGNILKRTLNGNRMAPNSALNFLLCGLAFILLAYNSTRNGIKAAQLLLGAAFSIALLAIIGYLYSDRSLYKLAGQYPAMPINSAISFLLLVPAVLLYYSRQGFMTVFSSHYRGGYIARRLLPLAIFMPIPVGYFLLLGQRNGIYQPVTGTSFLMIAIIVICSIVVWLLALWLNRSDEEKQKVEVELINAREVAVEAKRIQEQFMANMSHEIRTPMNGVIGMANLLSETTLDESQREFVETIRESADNLLVIINDILDFNKIASGMLLFEMVDFSVKGVVNSVLRITKYKADEKGIRITATFGEGIAPNYVGDPVRLNQVLTNLISNAIKFTEKGSVQIHVSLVSENEESSLLQFAVKDTGIGIPADKLEHIFESFTQASESTTRKYGGTGLGLAITRQLVELQHGKVSVESEEGKGSVFTAELSFTRSKTSLRTLITPDQSLPETKVLNGVNILLVEDNKINQRVAVYTIQKWGAQIDIANNGNEAITMLDRKTYEVILMDLQMPEMDGYETTTFIRRRMKAPTNGIPIIAMTASALIAERESCIAAGMTDYITKPFNSADLQQKILAAVNGEGANVFSRE